MQQIQSNSFSFQDVFNTVAFASQKDIEKLPAVLAGYQSE
jgi:hypothetical protein